MKFSILVISFVCCCFLCSCNSQSQEEKAAKLLISRILPKDYHHFTVKIIDTENEKDIFELSEKNGKIVLCGNNGISIACALNYYLTTHCKKEYSWNQLTPIILDKLPEISGKIRKESPYQYRYYLNYVAFNYSTVWWDWERWEKELDWMALHGINMPLAILGQDAVWQRVFNELGFTNEELSLFFSGPAYSAFNWMGLLDGWNGPLPQNWINQQEILQKKILQRARSLGMTPVLPAFTGHVPPSFQEKFPEAKLKQMEWTIFPKVNILDPDDPMFVKIGERFIKEQTRTYGTDHLYSVDTFIEGVPPSNDSIFLDNMISTIYKSMAVSDPKAIWVMQGWMLFFQESFWQKTQIEALLNAVDDDHLIMLDLYTDCRPIWSKTHAYGGKKWIWCTINNFGGRNSMFGRMDELSTGVFRDKNNPASGRLSGIGLTMEAIDNNEAIFKLMLENTWTNKPVDLDKWLTNYITARYGNFNQSLLEAWNILRHSVYNYKGDLTTCGPGSAITRVPSITGVSQWGSPYSYYDPADLLLAWEKMLCVMDTFKDDNNYQYDLLDITRQILANYSNELHADYVTAYTKKDDNQRKNIQKVFLELIDDTDMLLSTRKEFLLGTWIESARSCGTDENEKDLYERNARNLVTLWHGPEYDVLRDYSNRQWAGLMSTFYKVRWEKFFKYMNECATTGKKPDIDAFNNELRQWEWEWVQGHTPCISQPLGNTILAVMKIHDKYNDLMVKAFNKQRINKHIQ